MDAPASRPCMVIQGVWFLSPREALATLNQGALLVDLRSEDLLAMKTFSVPEWIHIPHTELEDRAAELPKDRFIILADTAGVYTKPAIAALRALGFEQLACLNGGMLAWDQEGFPVATDLDALLHGECACVMRSRKDRSAQG